MIIKAKAGTEVVLGNHGSSYPQTTSWGTKIPSIDMGVPLLQYSPLTTDPLTIWKTQPAVRKVVSFAAKQFAQIQWCAYVEADENDRRRLRTSPAERIMRKPVPLLQGFQFWQAMAIDRLLYDNCLAVLTEYGLVRVPPRLIHIKSDDAGLPRAILVKNPKGGFSDVTDAPKIGTFGWHPDMAGGVSPMYTLAAILNESKRAVEWRARKWENSPKMSGLLTRPVDAKRWDKEQKDSFLESWKAWASTEKAGGTPILENGMKYEQLEDLSPQDAQDIEGRKLTDIEVATAFHIPPELLGIREGNFASIDAWRQMLFGPVLGPMAVEFEQAVNEGGVVQALDVTPGVYLELDRDTVAAGTFLEKARTIQVLTGGPVMTRAEGRTWLRLPHLDGTDELVLPKNVTEGGQASPTDSGNQNVGSDNEQRETEEPQR